MLCLPPFSQCPGQCQLSPGIVVAPTSIITQCTGPCSLLFLLASPPSHTYPSTNPPELLCMYFLPTQCILLRSATCCFICPAFLGLARTFRLSSRDALLLPRPECRRSSMLALLLVIMLFPMSRLFPFSICTVHS